MNTSKFLITTNSNSKPEKFKAETLNSAFHLNINEVSLDLQLLKKRNQQILITNEHRDEELSFTTTTSSEWGSIASEIETWIEKSHTESKVIESFQKETLTKDITKLRKDIGDLIRTASLSLPD